MKKRFFAAVLCAMLLMTLFPATSFAVNVSAVQLGMSGVGTDDIIYFGTYNSENVPWYVWNTNGLLVSRYLLGSSRFQEWDDDPSFYGGSTLEEVIETRYNTIFPAAAAGSPAERNAILPTDLPGEDIGGTAITDAMLFALSFDEARSVTWGNSKLQARYFDDKTSKSGSEWWLRYSVSTFAAFTVLGDGFDGSQPRATTCGVRPAFNLDTSKVLFISSAINGKRSASSMDGALTAVPDATPSGTSHLNANIKLMEWKLTLDDSANRTSFDVSTAAVSTTTEGGSVEIAYSGAKAGTAEYLSAMLADSAGKVLYYGRLKNIASSTDASGTQSIAVPAGLAAGDYTLKIFNEQYNDNYKTDYASAMEDVTLTVTAPVISAAIGSTTVTGTAGTAITTVDATITLTNEQFNALDADADVSDWFTNLPAGLAAKIKTEVAANATTATVTFSGTPTAASTQAMAVTIPAASLVGNADLNVTANPDAKWNIAALTITFTTNPASATTVTEGAITATDTLTAAASVLPSGTATLNWYACDSTGTPSGTSLGMGGTFQIPTTLTAGTYYYLCQASAVGATNVNSTVATVTVNAPTPAFVPVTSITRNFAATVATNTDLTLAGTVEPTNATNQTIEWSVSPDDTGATGATVTGDTFRATAAGTATVRATITNGTAVGTPYTQDFDITVSAAPAVTHTVTYDANGGTDSMANGTATDGTPFTLPACTFTAPVRKQFKEWAIGSVDGTKFAAGDSYTFTADTTVYAIWEDIPAPPPGPAAPAPLLPTYTVYNDKNISEADVRLTGAGLDPSDMLIVERMRSGSLYDYMISLAPSGTTLRVYDISLKSGSKGGYPMYLSFDLGAEYEGQVFTLIHRKADGSTESFTAMANPRGTVTFGPLSELSPFSIVRGSVEPLSVAAFVAAVPDTGDAPLLWPAMVLVAGAAFVAVLGLCLRKRRGN